MRLDLNERELEILDVVLEAALRERLRQAHHADSRAYRQRLESETELLNGLKEKLGARYVTP